MGVTGENKKFKNLTVSGFSIIICCYNSQNRILETLRCLSELNKDSVPCEIIAIDNNSTDLTFNMLKENLPNLGIEFKMLTERNSGKTNALLKGFNEAKYDKMVICDDDVLLEKNYLQEAKKFFVKYPIAGIVGGQGELKSEIDTPRWLSPYKSALAIGPQEAENGSLSIERNYIWGAGSIINKNAFKDINSLGFPGFYTGVNGEGRQMTGEDSELSIWIRHAGYKLYYCENLRYIHNVDVKRISWIYMLHLQIGFSRSQVYLKMLQEILDCKNKKTFFEFKKYVIKETKIHFQKLLQDFFSVNYFKSLWISYVEKREGYAPTIRVNNDYFKLKEYIVNKKVLKSIFDSTK